MQKISTAGAVLVVLLGAGCGPGGVETSTDWSGVSGYTLVEVDGLPTVVGIDAEAGEARSLAVLPAKESDDTGAAPTLLRRGRSTLLAAPSKDGTTRAYEVVRGDDALNGIGTFEGGPRLLATATGWVRVEDRRVTLLDTELKPGKMFPLPGRVERADTDGRDTLCFTLQKSPTVQTLDLRTGQTRRDGPRIDGPAGALACGNGRGVAVEGSDAGSATVTRGPKVRVRVPGDHVDVVRVVGRKVFVGYGKGAAQALLEADLATGKVATTPLDTDQPATDLVVSKGHVTVVGDDAARIVDRETRGVESVALPGPAYVS